MMLRAKRSELDATIERLGSRSRARVEEARARLSIMGSRAVPALVDALEGAHNRVRAHVMPLLALIQDPRGCEPLTAMLLDRSPKMREIAARSLARFPRPDVVVALNRVVEKERRVDVRMAALQSLIEQYAAGQESAIRLVLDVLTDGNADERLRLAAFALLPSLRKPARRTLLGRLVADPNATVSRQAADWLDGRETAHTAERPADADDVDGWIQQLADEEYATWHGALQRLGSGGARVIDPLIAEMQRRAHDPEYCTRAGMALKALGARRARGLMDSLERLDEPLPLQVLVEVIGAFGEKSMIYRLRELIDRLGRRDPHISEVNGFDPMQRVLARAHLELARVGSRVAIDDLRRLIGDDDRRVDDESLEAVELIGKKEELGVLLAAFAREDAPTRRRIAEVVRGIMRRERIRRNDRMFRDIGRDMRRSLDSIRPRRASAAANGGRRPPRAARR